ncbi:MAG: preprotein translocase subunit YajC [Planctomycetaceae bacterium]
MKVLLLVNILTVKSAVVQTLSLAQGDAAPGGGAAQVNPLVQMAPMLVMFVVMFYFIVLRPQQREQKERAARLASLKKNDKVLTIGGIIGTIVDLSNDGTRVTLRVDDGTRIKFTRSSIQGPYEEKSESETSDK